MAIQNFISGGYYGKLGATVGQRWKNKRTIRTYVIPRNPRTPEQQANRGVFAEAVINAQTALQMNYYATCFDSESMTKWNYRMKTAKLLLQNGAQNLDQIPLHPINFVVPFQISSCSVQSTPDAHTVNFTITGNFPTEDRTLSALVDLYTANGVPVGVKMYLATYSVSNVGVLSMHVDDSSEINENCKIRFCSNDDVDSVTDMFASNELTIGAPAYDDRDFNTQIQAIQTTKENITIIFNEPYKANTATSFIGTVTGVTAGEIQTTAQQTLTLSNVNGYFAVVIPMQCSYDEQRYAFPSGSYVSITSIVATGTDFNYHSANVTENYADSSLTRTVESTPQKDMMLNRFQRLTWNIFNTETAIPIGSGSIKSQATGDNPNAIYSTWQKENNANKLSVYASGNAEGAPMLSGDWVTCPAFNAVSNGVTYTVAAQTQTPFTNGITSYTLNATAVGLHLSKDMGAGGSMEQLFINAPNFRSSVMLDDFTINPQAASLVMADGNDEEFSGFYYYAFGNEPLSFTGSLDDPDVTEGRTINRFNLAADSMYFTFKGLTMYLPEMNIAWADIPNA